MFKVKNKDGSISIVNFEHVTAGWELVSNLLFLEKCQLQYSYKIILLKKIRLEEEETIVRVLYSATNYLFKVDNRNAAKWCS